MQIIGDRHVRLIPDVMVGGTNGGGNGLVDGLLSTILWNQTGHQVSGEISSPESTANNDLTPTMPLENPAAPTNNSSQKTVNVTDNLKVKLADGNARKDDRQPPPVK
jgi:uncharacterized membrane protein YqiK